MNEQRYKYLCSLAQSISSIEDKQNSNAPIYKSMIKSLPDCYVFAITNDFQVITCGGDLICGDLEGELLSDKMSLDDSYIFREAYNKTISGEIVSEFNIQYDGITCSIKLKLINIDSPDCEHSSMVVASVRPDVGNKSKRIRVQTRTSERTL